MTVKCPTPEEISKKLATEELDYDFFREICPEYNRDLLEGIKPTLRIMIILAIILTIILDVACFKYRRLTKLILYFECLHPLLITMIPSPYWLELPIVWIGINYFIMFLCFYCGGGAQIVYTTFCLSLQILVIQTIGYDKTDYAHILGGIIMIVIFFILCSFTAVTIVYMKNLEQKKADALQANI